MTNPYSLGAVADVVDCEHKTASPAESGQEYGFSIGTSDIRAGRLVLDQAKRVDRATFDLWTRRATPVPGDLILAREAPVGQVGRVPVATPVCLGQRTVLIKVNPVMASDQFIHYLLLAPAAQNWMRERSAGSTVAHLNVADIREIPLSPFPPVEEQRRIAGALGVLDDHIEANRGLVVALGQMQAAAFSNAWDGKTRHLGDVAQVTMGQSPPGASYNECGDGMVFYQGVRDFGWRFPSRRVWTTAPTRRAAAGDVLVAVRAPVGKTNVAVETTALGRGLAGVRAPGRQATLLQSLSVDPRIWDPHQGTGTVFAAINAQGLRTLRIPWVDDARLEAGLATMDSAIFDLSVEMVRIAAVRDQLLPLLMSGRVSVDEAWEAVPGV